MADQPHIDTYKFMEDADRAVQKQLRQEMQPYRYKVEVERTASGKNRVEVRVYSDNPAEALREALELRREALEELGEES